MPATVLPEQLGKPELLVGTVLVLYASYCIALGHTSWLKDFEEIKHFLAGLSNCSNDVI